LFKENIIKIKVLISKKNQKIKKLLIISIQIIFIKINNIN